ncbi:D-tyrosyl-tRNA(Tyr) deacylase [bacterium]|nr:D-tyrosyl-tRNA(Tyr) deacylase [bacterium]
MRVVVQRVARAAVRVEGETVGAIGPGLVVLCAFQSTDVTACVQWMAAKLADLRIFPDAEAKLNRSLRDVGGAVLAVSQFTLYGDCRKGRRPSFVGSAPAAQAAALYAKFLDALRAEGLSVASGVFQAMMEVELVNAGPVTLIIDREARDAQGADASEGAG